MAECSVCGEKIPDGERTCSICGSSADEFLPMGTLLRTGPAFEDVPTAPILDDVPLEPFDGEVPLAPFDLSGEAPPMADVLDEAPPMADVLEAPAGAVKPDPGTPCLVLYGPDKQPLQYFALTKDATTIGRLDAVKGTFPDIDLDEWFDRTVVRRISRQHAVILRNRATSAYILRPLAGNTGTQLENAMLDAMRDYPLRPGHRIILGGAIRLKFEIA